MQNAFKNIPKSTKNLVDKLAVFNRKSVHKTLSGIKEAKYFYQEFLFLKTVSIRSHSEQNRYRINKTAIQKLEAAIALDPENHQYRLDWLKYRRPPVLFKRLWDKGCNFKEKIRMNRETILKFSKEMIAAADQFQRDFPDKNGGYRALQRIFYLWKIFYLNPRTLQPEDENSESVRIAKELANNLRPKLYNDKLNLNQLTQYGPYGWSKDIVKLSGFEIFLKNFNIGSAFIIFMIKKLL